MLGLARRIDTREALLLVFFATFIVAMRAAMRWHVGVPGHSMLAACFGLVLARSCVDRRFAASLCGLLAGVVIAGLGMGRGGPLILLKLLVPGLLVDLGAAGRKAGASPPFSIARGALFGALAGASGFFPSVIVEALAGLDARLLLLHAFASASGKAIFGALGGAAGAWVARELQHHGLLPELSEPRSEALPEPSGHGVAPRPTSGGGFASPDRTRSTANSDP